MALKDLWPGRKKNNDGNGLDGSRPGSQDLEAAADAALREFRNQPAGPQNAPGWDPYDGDSHLLMADQYCDIVGVPPVDDDRDSFDAFQISDEWPVPPPGFGGPGGNSGYVAEMEAMTGYTQYTYYHGSREIGGAMAHALPGFPADIRGSGLSLSTQFDATMFPGCIREIRDEISHRLWGTVTYQSEGTHILKVQDVEIVVKSREGEWRFLQKGKPLGVLKRADAGSAKRLILTPKETLDDDLALLLLSFPLLQIAW